MPTQIDCVTIETINDNDNNNLLYKLVIFIFQPRNKNHRCIVLQLFFSEQSDLVFMFFLKV